MFHSGIEFDLVPATRTDGGSAPQSRSKKVCRSTVWNFIAPMVNPSNRRLPSLRHGSAAWCAPLRRPCFLPLPTRMWCFLVQAWLAGELILRGERLGLECLPAALWRKTTAQQLILT